MGEHKIKKIIIIVLMLVISFITFAYWLYGKYFLSTEDAYVNANVTHITSNVTGQIANLYVKENQYVKTGELLLELEQAPFELAVEQAKAKLAMDEAKLVLAGQVASRVLALSKKNMLSVQERDNAQANLEAAKAQVEADKASLGQTKLNLSYIKIIAPTNGWLGNVTLNKGDAVTAMQPLFTLVNDDEFWVDANFKETDLHYIHIGQQAKVEVDMYPGRIFEGTVESISRSSGAAFSLFPPENATGNWVKVTQRVPVRIRIEKKDPQFPLRIGTTATVTIKIHS